MVGDGMQWQWMIRAVSRITTTAPTRRAQPFLPERWVRNAQALGWYVRLAGPRYFIMWRNRLSPDTAPRILVLPHRDCGLSSMEYQAVLVDLAGRARLPVAPEWIKGPGQYYWLERAERRLVERIAPISARMS